jgi:hypothetical protein
MRDNRMHATQYPPSDKVLVTVLVKGTFKEYTLGQRRAIQLYEEGKIGWNTNAMHYTTLNDGEIVK